MIMAPPGRILWGGFWTRSSGPLMQYRYKGGKKFELCLASQYLRGKMFKQIEAILKDKEAKRRIPNCLQNGGSTDESKFLRNHIFKFDDCSKSGCWDAGIRYPHVKKHLNDPSIPRTRAEVAKLWSSKVSASRIHILSLFPRPTSNAGGRIGHTCTYESHQQQLYNAGFTSFCSLSRVWRIKQGWSTRVPLHSLYLLMANPYQRAIFVLREISKIQSRIVPIRIFKMHKIIVDYEFKDDY